MDILKVNDYFYNIFQTINQMESDKNEPLADLDVADLKNNFIALGTEIFGSNFNPEMLARSIDTKIKPSYSVLRRFLDNRENIMYHLKMK